MRIALTIVCIAATVWAAVILWRAYSRTSALDFYVVWANSEAVQSGDRRNIYAPETEAALGAELFARAQRSNSAVFRTNASERQQLDTSGTPFLYTSFVFFPSDYERALLAYRVLLIAALVSALVIAARMAGVAMAVPFAIAAPVLVVFGPFVHDFIVGNVNTLQLFGLVLAVLVSKRSPVAGAAVMAVLCVLKPTIVVVIVLMAIVRIVTRDFARLRREAIGAAAGGLAAMVVSALWFHTIEVWPRWIRDAVGAYERLPEAGHNNVAPALPLFQNYGTWLSPLIAALLIALVCVVVRRCRRADELLLVSLGVLVFLLSSTLVWLHYLTIALLPAVVLMRNRRTAPLAVCALLLMADVPYAIVFGPMSAQARV